MMDYLSVALGIIGAAAWLPAIRDWYQRPVIEGKFLSSGHMVSAVQVPTANESEYERLEGTVVVLSLSLISLRKSFQLRDFVIRARLGKEVVEMVQFYVPLIVSTSPNQVWTIPQDKDLYFMSTLPKDQTVRCYLRALLPAAYTFSDWESIILEFTSYDGFTSSVVFEKKLVNFRSIAYMSEVIKPLSESEMLAFAEGYHSKVVGGMIVELVSNNQESP
jgi:hypothetical protein